VKSEPYIVVHPPNDRGLREVTTLEATLGQVWSKRDLGKLLRRAAIGAAGIAEYGQTADGGDDLLPP
jgi:hypothetical protein